MREPKRRRDGAWDTSISVRQHVTLRPRAAFGKVPRGKGARAPARGRLPNVGQTRRECAYCAAVPLDSKIRVYRSPIHGYGVIALRDFEADEVVAEVEGVLYREAEIEDDTYCLWVDEDYYLDMVDQT